MNIPSERQERVKEIERKIESLDKRAFHWSRDGVDTSALTREIEQLRAERDRLLQSSGGEASATEKLINDLEKAYDWIRAPDWESEPWDSDRIAKWINERPTSAIIKAAAALQRASTPAEPSPPGSGEPVGWVSYNADKPWFTDDPLVAEDWHSNGWKPEPLYAAPLPSASEGAGDEAETIEALRSALKAAGHTTADGTWIAAGTGRVIATILRALRTRATATGGGDNG